MLIIYKMHKAISLSNRTSKIFRQTLPLEAALLKNPKIIFIRKHLLRDQILSAIISKTKSILSTSISTLPRKMARSIHAY